MLLRQMMRRSFPFITSREAFGNVILVYHELVDVVRQQFFQLITDVILQFGKWYGFLFIDAFY